VKVCEDFVPNFGDNKTDRCIAKTHLIFTREAFTRINMRIVPHPPYDFSVSSIEDIPHFDTTEVIEPVSQALLNTLTECDLQDAFKNDRSAKNNEITSFRLSFRNSRLRIRMEWGEWGRRGTCTGYW
jgi:hypothetical protein